MKRLEKGIRAAIFAGLIFGVVLSCENPFEQGLGPKVDIIPPTLTLEGPSPASERYLTGLTRFYGKAEDDRAVSSVHVSLDNGDSWNPVNSYDPGTKEWFFYLDTLYLDPAAHTIREDGPLSVRFKAIDDSGKPYESIDFSFYAKNRPPELELQYPQLKGNQFISGHADDRLDYTLFPTDRSIPATGGALRGFVTDMEGIAPGYPKIKFWKGANEPADTEYHAAEFDDRDTDREKEGKILTAKAFRYTLVEASDGVSPGRTYDNSSGFEITTVNPTGTVNLNTEVKYSMRLLVKDKKGVEKYYPPRDTDGYVDYERDDEGQILTDHRYVSSAGPVPITFYPKISAEKVEIEPYYFYDDNLEESVKYPDKQFPLDAYHKYVNESQPVYKHGDFVLQVLTSHSEGVDQATLRYEYFEYSNLDTPKFEGPLYWNGDQVKPQAQQNLGTSLDQSGTGTRRVFKFTASLADSALFEPLVGTEPAEGLYKLIVTGMSSGNENDQVFTIHVDKTRPDVQINTVSGGVAEADTAGLFGGTPVAPIEFYRVNGTIRVSISTFDKQSGLRSVKDEEKLSFDRHEQKWLLVSGTAAAALDALITADTDSGGNEWYFPEDDSTKSPEENGYFEGSFLIRNTDQGQYSPGQNYLYFFGRDQAFNVHHDRVPFYIDQPADRPAISSGDIDFNLALANKSGITAANNVIDGQRGISLILSDDDSLDLSTLIAPAAEAEAADGITSGKRRGIQIYLAAESDADTASPTWYQLSEAAIQEAFGRNSDYGSSNGVVLSLERTLRVSHLAKTVPALPAALINNGELADGKYKLKIILTDWQVKKEPVDNPPPPVSNITAFTATGVAAEPCEFWFAVDRGGPAIEISSHPLDLAYAANEFGKPILGVNPADYDPDFPNGYLILSGTVSDANDLVKDTDDLAYMEISLPFKTGYVKIKENIDNTGDTPSDLDTNQGKGSLTLRTHAEGTPWVYDWAYKFDVEHLQTGETTGERHVALRAGDTFGNRSEDERTLLIDDVFPTVSFLNEIAVVNYYDREHDTNYTNAVNGTLRFSVSPSDNNFLDNPAVKWWLVPHNASDPIPPLTMEFWSQGTAANASHEGTINTAALNADGVTPQYPTGEYRLYVGAKDTANNITLAARPGSPTELYRLVYVNQDSDYPQIVGTELRPNNAIKGVLGSGTAYISGLVRDDDGFDENKPYVYIRVSRNDIDWTEWKAAEGVLQSGGYELSFELNLKSSSLGLNLLENGDDDGTLYYQIYALDEPTVKGGDPALDVEAAKEFYRLAYYPPVSGGDSTPQNSIPFTYDTQPPRLSFDAVQDKATFSSFPEWTNVFVDEPNFHIGNGEAADLSGILFSLNNLPYKRILPADLEEKIPSEVTGTRQFRIKRTAILSQINGEPGWKNDPPVTPAIFPDGSYNIVFQAVDEGGSTGQGIFAFTKDTLGPAITFNNIVPGEISVITDPNSPEIRGKISDDFSPVKADGQDGSPAYRLYKVQVDGKIDLTPDAETGQLKDEITTGWTLFGGPLLTGSGKVVEWRIPFEASSDYGELPDGLYKVEIKAADEIGNVSEALTHYNGNTTHNENILFRLDRAGPAFQDAGLSEGDPEYVANNPVYVRALPAGKVFSAIPAANAAEDTVFTVYGTIRDPNLSELSLWVGGETTGVTARTIAIPGAVDLVSLDPAASPVNLPYTFYSDSLYPDLGFEITLDQEVVTDNTFGDTYVRKISWKYRVRKDEFNTVGGGDAVTGYNGASFPNGEYPLFLRTLDKGGRKTEYSWRFFKDSTKPVIEFPSLEEHANTLLSSDEPRISVLITDLNTVRTAMATIQKWDYTNDTGRPSSIPSVDQENGADPKEPGWWVAHEGPTSLFNSADENAAHEKLPNKRLSTESLTKSVDFLEGKYRIKVAAQDYSMNDLDGPEQGNPNASGWKVFYVDPKAPVYARDSEGIYINKVPSTDDIRLTGTVYDPNRIVSVRGRINAGTGFGSVAGTAAEWKPLLADQANGYDPATAHHWDIKLNVSGVTGTPPTFTAYVEFLDYAGMAEVKAYEFTLDDEKPTFSVAQPVDPAPLPSNWDDPRANSRITGTYELRGSAGDNFAIDKVEYKLGATAILGSVWYSAAEIKNSSDIIIAHWTGGWSWSLSIPNVALFAEGTSPGDLDTSDANDNNWFWTTTGNSGTNPYVTWVDSLDSANGLAKTENNVWKLPLKVRVTDVAGNYKEFDRAYFVDPDGDKPRVEFLNPETGSFVDGETQISGAAFDNDKIHGIAYRVLTTTDNWLTSTAVELEDRVPGDMDTQTGPASERWYMDKISVSPNTHMSSQVSWNFNLNTTGQFTNDLGDGESLKVKVQVVAWDSLETTVDNNIEYIRKIKGDVKEIDLTFEKGAPVFTSDFAKLDRDGNAATIGDQRLYSSYPTVKDQFLVLDQVSDDFGIERIRIRRGGTAGTYEAIPILESSEPTPASGAYAVKQDVAPKPTYNIYIPVNANALGPLYENGAKTYRLEIQASDGSQPQHTTTRILDIRIDNFNPLGVYTGSSTAIGTHYSIQGKISDYHGSNSVSGVSDTTGKVLAWFQRGGNILRLDNGTPVTNTTTETAMLNRYVDGNGDLQHKGASVPITIPVVDDANKYNGILISGNQTGTAVDGSGNVIPDGNNTTKSWQSSGSDVLWLAQVDTTKLLPSGPVDFCYLIYDDSGNITAYTKQRLIVSNGRPIITGVFLGTDLYNAGAHLGAGEMADPAKREDEIFLNTAYENSGLTARNSNVFVRGILSGNSEEQGSGARIWRLSYIEEKAEGENLKTPGELTAGNFYEIKTLEPDTNWQSAGAPAEHGLGTVFMATQALLAGTAEAQELTLIQDKPGSAENSGFTYLYKNDPSDEGTLVSAAKESHFVYKKSDDFGSGKIKESGDLRFILKVFDSTGGSEADSLSDFKLIGLKIDNGSPGAPGTRLYDMNPNMESAVTPGNTAATIANAAATGDFTDRQENGSFTDVVNENLAAGLGLYNAGNSKNPAPSGHIEPRTNTAYPGLLNTTTMARDMVSGSVILRGYASDDQRIDSISLVFSDSATPNTPIQTLTILKWDETTRKLIPAAAGLYAYTTELMDLRGHRVQWSFLWDTQNYPADKVVYQNMLIEVQAKDLDSLTGAHTSALKAVASDNASHNRRPFDLAPFITGFRRSRSNAAAVRTKMGWYTVDADGTSGDTLIVQGYNLVSSGGATAMSVGNVAATPGTQSAAEVRFNLPNTTKPGEVVLTAKTSNAAPANQEAVNSLATHTDPALNHKNPWNMEDQDLGWDDRWNDQRRLRIWQSNGSFGGTSHGNASGTAVVYPNNSNQSSIGAVYPAMAINSSTRTLSGSWAKLGNNATYFGNSTGGGWQIFHWVDPQDETDIAVGANSSGETRYAVVYNNTGAYTDSPNASDQTGGIQVFDSHSDSWWDTSGVNPPGLSSSHGGAYIVEKVRRSTSDHILDRFAGPHIAVQGEYYHVAYHDRIDRSIKYWWNKRGSERTRDQYDNNTSQTIDGATIVPKRWVNLDGGYSTNDGYDANQSSSRVRIGTDRTTGDSNGAGTSIPTTNINAAGEYNAIDFNSNGHPVIAYYDMKNQKLKLAYAYTARPLSGADWAVQDVVNDGTISGQYVSMRIDRTINTDRIHLSYYKSDTGELAYVSGTRDVSSEIVAATGLGFGSVYEIRTSGSTDWTRLGAANSNVGTYFIAKDPAGYTPGTGDAYKYSPSIISQTAAGLETGKPYLITTPGDVNWTLVGASANTANTSFIASRTLNAGNAYEYRRNSSTQNSSGLVPGNVYQINSRGNSSWTSVGASSNTNGVIFIATGSISGTGSAYTFTGGTSADLKASTALSTTSGTVYKINTPGDMNWTNAGAANNNVNTLFTPTRALILGATVGYTRSGKGYIFDAKVVVDNTGMAGKWSDISIDRNGNPWITYQDITRSGTFDGAKMAYLPGALKNDIAALWKVPVNWETMNIPGRYRVQDARLSIENPLDTEPSNPTWADTWDAAVGFQSDYFRIAYFQDN
jgi:hypothetical protein